MIVHFCPITQRMWLKARVLRWHLLWSIWNLRSFLPNYSTNVGSKRARATKVSDYVLQCSFLPNYSTNVVWGLSEAINATPECKTPYVYGEVKIDVPLRSFLPNYSMHVAMNQENAQGKDHRRQCRDDACYWINQLYRYFSHINRQIYHFSPQIVYK